MKLTVGGSEAVAVGGLVCSSASLGSVIFSLAGRGFRPAPRFMSSPDRLGHSNREADCRLSVGPGGRKLAVRGAGCKRRGSPAAARLRRLRRKGAYRSMLRDMPPGVTTDTARGRDARDARPLRVLHLITES